MRADAFDGAYTPRSLITHRVNVRPFAAAKRQAMLAHRSQATADVGTRTLSVLLKLPRLLFARVMGTEWFVEPGRDPTVKTDDIFATLR